MHDHGRIARVAPGWNSEWNEKRENEYSVGYKGAGEGEKEEAQRPQKRKGSAGELCGDCDRGRV